MKNDLAFANFTEEHCHNIMLEKYAQPGETSKDQIFARVAGALAVTPEQRERFMRAQSSGFIAGGRVNAAAGSGRATTMINCFVVPVGDTIVGHDENGLPGIFTALQESAETMRRGGGVGYDFSNIRPMGALVKGTHSRASGPVSYMRVFDTMCQTVESAGARRGAQMGILRVDHPDIELFIDSKLAPELSTLGLEGAEAEGFQKLIASNWTFRNSFIKSNAKLSNFNISVGVTDDFMDAVIQNKDFDLVHAVPPAGEQSALKTIVVGGKTKYVYRTVRARDLYARIMRNTYNFADPGIVFVDRMNTDNNLRYIETLFAVNPCGEHPLPAYGCCCLGTLDIGRFIDEPFTKNARFRKEDFVAQVRVGVEFLNQVLDKTAWPLEAQRSEAQAKRRIGLNPTGLGDAFIMMGYRYGSAESVAFAKEVFETYRDAAYEASIDLAEELGAFPLFSAEGYLQEGTFASRLPQRLKDRILKSGIRNSHLLSCAPTGTISMAFAKNASSGIEPVFSHVTQRKKIKADGSDEFLTMRSRVSQMYFDLYGKEPEGQEWATAQDLSVDDHLNVLGAIAPLIDAAISKTVNVPGDYPFDGFQDVYTKAWRMGLKGITTYRPNDMLAAVLVAKKSEEPAKAEPEQAPAVHGTKVLEVGTNAVDPDRRVELKSTPQLTADLKFPKRPTTAKGVEGKLYQMNHPTGEFAVTVTHWVNGTTHPLDVYVSGSEQPRGIAALARMLSIDIREEDPAWIAMKLDSLVNTQSDDGFVFNDPATGNEVMAPSLVSGFAAVVKHRLAELGALQTDQRSRMIEALLSRKEPKTDAVGAMGWHVDVHNPVTGDDFLMVVKELRLPDGTVRPYSVWLSGAYPSVLDGLTKMLSIDMRISDPAWAIRKLEKLRTFNESRGDFLAQVPGEARQQNYPSTVAYIAELLLHRYKVLGLVKEVQGAVQSEVTSTEVAKAAGGMFCPSCHTMSLHKRDGCKVCDHCGFSGDCG